MQFFVDLRYVVPPLINLTLRFLIPQPNPWAQDPSFNNPIFVMAFLLLAIAILLFLFTSIKLPLSVEPLRLRAGHDFSAPLTILLLASVSLPSSLFWYVFPILGILSPWYEILLDLFKCFISWFRDTFHAIPALFITCSAQRPEVELEAIVVEGNHEAESADI